MHLNVIPTTLQCRRRLAGAGRLIDYVRPGDRLCVIHLDRLAHLLKELLKTVEELKSRDIHFISLKERTDTSSAASELVFHDFRAMAHFERQLISERTREGIAAACRRGGGQPGFPQRCHTVNAAGTVAPGVIRRSVSRNQRSDSGLKVRSVSPMYFWRGLPIFWVGSAIISFHWEIQPTVRDRAKIGVNIDVGNPMASRIIPE